MSTQDLQWLLLRQQNSFLVKQHGLPRVFSREPGNIAAIHSYKYSGLINDKAVGVEAAPSGRGIVLTTKKSKIASNAVKGTRNVNIIVGGSRRAAGKVSNVVGKRGYRSDLVKDTVARASAILRSQRPGSRKQPRARTVRGGKKPVVVSTDA
ncbi:ribosomal protein L28 [Tilletiaria anomala UBC 951]|uniref:Ribosomal protein L28 n=1 Tax=Tilletiaria anomala (strain ATCC 24038 / CBS 436.72 / UBC 951) TaxID=1037660 RepID=A0A066W600_TILAU|nr:ribosomal protein L28 [Tilletiaria anomala UBC 951]KDN47963.1 ribosomal protein L28 [Tilletiaria anomala UBC 951]